ncbi:His Kinase A (phospho-acceptor) domain-containing protein [Eubacterium aggregans]|uniref:histidine kinase n=1 Tax=Eubacterium aggregans TaxID=81409 RepID=A0A1H3ZDY8_9FIRM|nr:HAMP domain-containing sensor histidine kinase [Eubacterium aggregans]SEA21604.1 His Kinase A (phospho-acceptor) domain-containing protein [Eubacterium aggregans]
MIKHLLRGIGIFSGALILSLGLFMVAFLGLAGYAGYLTHQDMGAAAVPIRLLSQGLTTDAGGYTLAPECQDLLSEYSAWAILINDEGEIIWSQNKPEDIPDHYTLSDVASFTHWYLGDYPVTVWNRADGLLVAGSPPGMQWKYNLTISIAIMELLKRGIPTFFFTLLISVILLVILILHYGQKKRDRARSGWIDGISHDIRTPLAIIMGKAEALSTDSTLCGPVAQDANAILTASQNVRDLISDLNLTMRLDYAMEPLGLESVAPAPLLRALGAEVLNSGLASSLEINIAAEAEKLILRADPSLLRRALLNLIQNALRHGSENTLTLGLTTRRRQVIFTVTNAWPGLTPSQLAQLGTAPPTRGKSPDGLAPHGTGLTLVRRIAAVHKGRLAFTSPEAGRLQAELWLPSRRWYHPFP